MPAKLWGNAPSQSLKSVQRRAKMLGVTKGQAKRANIPYENKGSNTLNADEYDQEYNQDYGEGYGVGYGRRGRGRQPRRQPKRRPEPK